MTPAVVVGVTVAGVSPAESHLRPAGLGKTGVPSPSSSSDGRYQPADTGQAAEGVGVTGAFLFTPADTDPATAGVQSDVVSYKWRLNSGAVSAPITVAKGTAAVAGDARVQA
ncbi:hypothetical protein [Streptomyces sp. NPDC014995]|uniref:hypothetical protein n=1 Tax=Streptomyces sp. NPDC014995 TaxID=3364936 RepID=UPI0036F514E2